LAGRWHWPKRPAAGSVNVMTSGQSNASEGLFSLEKSHNKADLTNTVAPASQRSPYKDSIESHRRQEDGGAVSDEPTRDNVATGLPVGFERKLATVLCFIKMFTQYRRT
jgi:hypothetical protein